MDLNGCTTNGDEFTVVKSKKRNKKRDKENGYDEDTPETRTVKLKATIESYKNRLENEDTRKYWQNLDKLLDRYNFINLLVRKKYLNKLSIN